MFQLGTHCATGNTGVDLMAVPAGARDAVLPNRRLEGEERCGIVAE
jgi:hypothetical protein